MAREESKTEKRTSFISFIMLINLTSLLILLFIDILLRRFNLFILSEKVINNISFGWLLFVLLLFAYSAYVIFFFIIKPIKAIEKMQSEIIYNDLKSLNLSIAEFARGNITVSVKKSDLKPLPLTRNRFTSSLIELYNQLYTRVSESITDFNNITEISCRRLFYVGADSYLEGEECGKIMGRLLNGSGEVVVLLKSVTKVNHNLRRKGFTNYLLSNHPDIKIVEVYEEDEVSDKTYEATKEAISKWSQLSGIYITEGTTPGAAAKAVKELNKVNKIKIVAHDITEITAEYIREGVITAALSQNPYVQGYDSVMKLYNYLIDGHKTIITRFLTNLEEINKGNITKHWDDQKGQLLSDETKKILARPRENIANKKLKISIIPPEDANFWKPIYTGAEDAGKLLKQYNTDVQIIIREEIKRGDWSTAAYKRAINNEIEKGVDAIAIPIFEKEIVPYVNELIEKEIPIASFNSDPIGFRPMLETIVNNTMHMNQASKNLSANSEELIQATIQINETMKLILSSTTHQLDQLSDTAKKIDILLNNVNEINNKATESIKTADITSEFADIGQSTVYQTSTALKKIQSNYDITTNIIATLSNNSIKIQEIINLIQDLASQTNLIAVNASILAARSGEEGKGFSVVANEIKKLAEKSASGAVDITKLIETTLKNISEATDIIVKDINDVSSSVELANQAESALNDIKHASIENIEKTKNIIDFVNEMKDLSESVRALMEELSKLNHENNSAIEEITAATQEIGLQVKENRKVSLILSDMAQSQKDILAQFIV